MTNKQITIALNNCQTKIEILEVIQMFKNLRGYAEQSFLNAVDRGDKELEQKYLENVEHYDRCINRMIQRYNKII